MPKNGLEIAAPWVNLGEMVNKGIDVTLNYKTKGSQDFSWNSSLTFSHYKNEVKELLGDLTIFGEMTFYQVNEDKKTLQKKVFF